MKNACKCILQEFLMNQLSTVRFEKQLTQEKFAELLLLETRSYAAIEKGEYGCCALTLAMFLLFCCKDAQAFLDELRPRIMNIINPNNEDKK